MHCIIGIDEAGRGPLAGPVMVGGVLIRGRTKIGREGKQLRDSKRLSEKQREEWFSYLRAQSAITCAVSRVNPEVIDAINITRAANRAATQTLLKLLRESNLSNKRIQVLLDGGLFVIENRQLETHNLQLKTVVRGDETVPTIMLASIVAKVTRDHYMVRKHNEYPEYGFDRHKGYGTKLHRETVQEIGPCPLHRLTFLRKWITLEP